MLLVRFDMRTPGHTPVERADQYKAVVELCEWMDRRGPAVVVLSEHHASPDGYLPSPITLASAIAARTEQTFINIAAVIAPLHHPVELAEQMVVLDYISRGRVSYVLGLGYRAEEYDLFGKPFGSRGRDMEATISQLREAFAGGVTPEPFTPGGPRIAYGGGSAAAARRAGRLGLDMFAETSDPTLEPIFRAAAAEAGHESTTFFGPREGAPTAVVVVDDVDQGWRDYGPHLLHDALTYGAWLGAAGNTGVAYGTTATTVEEMRENPGRYRLVDVQGAKDLIAEFGMISLTPMCGGAPPELARRCIELATSCVG